MYGLITYIRNRMFDCGILKTSRFKTCIVSVGNLKAGGTGKTPFVEYLIKRLHADYRLGVISRGYGRKTTGFGKVTPQGSAEEFGDEPLQMARKFPDVRFFVSESRNEAMRRIESRYPEINLVLLDDAYQHRYTARDVNILLTEYKRPFFADRVIPFGLLREYRKGYKRADCIVITKCPELDDNEKRAFVKKLNPLPDQRVFFARIGYQKPYLLSSPATKVNLQGRSVFLFSAIANNCPLIEYLKSQTELLDVMAFKDHHSFSAKELNQIKQRYRRAAKPDSILLTTEKDASRLKDFNERVYVLPIETLVESCNQNNETIEQIIKTAICTKR